MHLSAAAIPGGWSKSIGRRASLAALSALVLAATPSRAMALHETVQQADGLAIYFTVIPAAFARSHPPDHTGRDMPSTAPKDQYSHHLIVALFDSTTGMRITDASVVAVVQGGRQSSATRIELEPMAIAGGQAYGGFANLPPRDRYRFEIEVVRPGGGAVVRAVFSHQHLQPQP
ncbi:MAG: hypothetical protein HYX38_37665 [Rhodospirillales bacterium]|nr:hypothetical protein [Rhodospirillales bacterium]